MPEANSFSDAGPDLWHCLGWQPNETQLSQLKELQALLRHWNSRVNLTRLVENEEFWISQVFDSLWPLEKELRTPDRTRRCIDVGTGGGFPGLAVAIALPGTTLTLVDSVGRKTAAVESMANSLDLGARVDVRTERVEVTGQERSCRGAFDLAMARAVATPPVVAEYLVPLLAHQGQALLYRGHWSSNDEAHLKRALVPLKAKLADCKQINLPAGRGLRTLVRIEPLAPCPKSYPRQVGLPSRLPLGHQADDKRS